MSRNKKLKKFFVSKDYVYTLDEEMNMCVDKIAEHAYKDCKALTDEARCDKQWNAIRGHPGTVTWNHHVITGKVGITIKACLQKSLSRDWVKKFWKTEMALRQQKDHNWMMSHDEKLHKANEAATIKTGGRVRTMKLAQGLLATNAFLKTQSRTPLARCSCCYRHVETLNHLVGHCRDSRIATARLRLIAKIHALLTELCKNSKAPRLAAQLKAIWSLETIKEAYSETNGSAMVGGKEEGAKWIGVAAVLRSESLPGGCTTGTMVAFNNNNANEDHSWGIKWEGNDTTLEYSYKTVKPLVNQKTLDTTSKAHGYQPCGMHC